MEETKFLVGPKIESTTPGYEKLQWLFDDGTILDELIDRIVIPVLVATPSEAAKNFDKEKGNYTDLVIEEYDYISGRFSKSEMAGKVRIVIMYVPLASKEELEEQFITKLSLYE